MSASNWRECPKCFARRKEYAEKERKKLAASYGNVSADEYERMRRAVENRDKEKPDKSLREDYLQRMRTDGVYEVSYYCLCQSCGFTFKFEHEQPAT